MLLVCLCSVQPLTAQTPDTIRRLPPIDATFSSADWLNREEPAFRLASDPIDYRLPEDVLATTEPAITTHKNGFFQKLSFTGTHVFRNGSDGVGLFETETFGAFALPAPTADTPLILLPTLEVYFPDAPLYPDIPSELYGTFLEFMWWPKVGDRLSGIVSVAPSWYSDFQGDTSEGFRWTGKGLVRYQLIEERLEVVAGVLYLNRYYSRIIPAGGIMWKPNPDWNLELVFPRTKLARRLTCGKGYETWAYLSGGFGGNSWSIVNAANAQDTLVIRDWRLMGGFERKGNGGSAIRFELGYVFSREVELASTNAKSKPDDTLLMRGVFEF